MFNLPYKIRFFSKKIVFKDGINVMRQKNILRLIDQKFKSLGYRCVALDLQGYRSGSLNMGVTTVIKLESNATVETSLNG